MRVLWFSNTPGLASDHLKSKGVGGGWISAMQAEVERSMDCELGYVFYTVNDIEPFTVGKTNYFPVKRKDDTKLKRYINRLLAKVEYDEHLETFLDIIEKFKPDLIHIHGTENSFGLIIPYISKIPVVISIQGNLTLCTEKYFAGIDKKFVKNNLNWFFNKAIHNFNAFSKRAKIEQEILNYAIYIFGRTDWDRRITSIMAPKSKYFCIHEIIRPAFYHHRWFPVKNQVPIFFTTSSDNLYKGFETIVNTAIQLKKINYKFEWKVAGLSLQDELVKLTMKQEKVNNLEAIGIELLGKVTEDVLINHMLKANVYIQVSHIENSPNSLCEAMLLGMPIISSDVGGTSSLIANNESGVLLQDGDAYSLAGALLELIENEEKAVAFGKKAYEVSHDRHKPERIIKALENAYATILQESKGIVEQLVLAE